MEVLKYSKDKPADCAFCYFWGGKKKGCTLKQCHYLLPPPEIPDKPKESEEGCGDCPYGKHDPCIGYCLKKIMMELRGSP